MPRADQSFGHLLGQAFAQVRVGLACAVTVAVIAIFALHAPVGPVILGCGGAWAVLLAVAFIRSWHSRKS